MQRVGHLTFADHDRPRLDGVNIHRALDRRQLGVAQPLQEVEAFQLGVRGVRLARPGRARLTEQLVLAPLERGIGVTKTHCGLRQLQTDALVVLAHRDDRAPGLGQTVGEPVEHGDGQLVVRAHVGEVDDDELEVVEVGDDRAVHLLGRREEQIALELEKTDRAPALCERVVLRHRAHAVRRDLLAAQRSPHNRPYARAPAEQMESQLVRQPFAHPNSTNAVALLVERRREDADPELSG